MVVTAGAVVAAFLSGLVYAAVIAGISLSGRWEEPEARPGAFGLMIAAAAGGFVFIVNAFQVVTSIYVDHDPLWTRVLSRSLTWYVACVALGVGVWILLRRRGRSR